ncbi:N-acetyltransferase [Salinicoccus sp. YB14-2]|uniref:GNAT family N-acetyltransferase n=1 Tax=Salinicoccus sp. YB14-2 TaxID=1572701 RepID=UPI00068ECBDB|nr:GNAT family N-acetyltransferase [Salinicoccus sp. YB14-2]
MNTIQLKSIDENNDLENFYDLIMKNKDYFDDYVEYKPTFKEVKEEFLLDVPLDVPLNNKNVLGIYKQNDLIGFLDILLSYPDNATCMIGYLVVDQNYRGQGIGQEVYNRAKSMMIENNMKNIRLGVIKDNIPAVSMWEKQGFQVVDKINTEYGVQLTMESYL